MAFEYDCVPLRRKMRKKILWSVARELEIVALYRVGRTGTGLARTYGCQASTIYNVLIRYGVKRRGSGSREKAAPPPVKATYVPAVKVAPVNCYDDVVKGSALPKMIPLDSSLLMSRNGQRSAPLRLNLPPLMTEKRDTEISSAAGDVRL